MRKTIQPQLPMVNPFIEHEHAQELQASSDILDGAPEVLERVYADLVCGGVQATTGREGMTAEQVLRALLIKQLNGFSYEELAFHLADSRCYRAFCRLGIAERTPSRSTLQHNIKRLRAATLEAINRRLVEHAATTGVERGRKVRVDCTVMDANIHAPTDSALLWDCVRVVGRLLEQARKLVEMPVTDHRRRAKRRAVGIQHAKTATQRLKLYRDLLKVARKTVCGAERAATALDACANGPMAAAQELAAALRQYVELAHQVIAQTERRVLHGEQVPAAQKVVSIFEPHTDIIVKDRRSTQDGHKLCLSSGASGMVLDCVVEEGNPADATLAVTMAERHTALFGKPPRQAAFDGGFASKDNLVAIKKLGVKDVAFSKRRGLAVSAMVKSSWVYRRLRHFRAGIEGIISFLKRSFGLSRCTWRGHASFKAYAWASIVTANLLLLARHTLARSPS